MPWATRQTISSTRSSCPRRTERATRPSRRSSTHTSYSEETLIFERAKFNRRRQEEGESVETFITTLFTLAEHCGYGDLHDEMIRDRIVVGIRNSALSEKLQLDSELTLDKAITRVRQAEAVKQQQPLLRGKPDTPVGALQKGRGGSRGGRGGTPAGSKQPQSQQQSACTRCGRRPAHDKAQCPARNQTSNKCKKLGHFAAVCRTSKKVRNVQTNQDSAEEDAFLGTVSHESSDADWTIELTLQGKPAQLHIDTGAEVTVITERTWKGVGQPPLELPDRTLRGPDSTAIATLGKFTGTFGISGRQAEGDVYVAKGLTRSLLGQPMISNLQLVRRVASVEPTSELSPKEEFPSLFRGLGKVEGEYTIELRDDAEPYSLSTPRRVAIPLLNCVRQELQRMEELGVIAKVNQPTEWCSSMVVVPKDN
jgi:hypothetical protein